MLLEKLTIKKIFLQRFITLKKLIIYCVIQVTSQHHYSSNSASNARKITHPSQAKCQKTKKSRPGKMIQ